MRKWAAVLLTGAAIGGFAIGNGQAGAAKLGMSYLYFGRPSEYVALVDTTKGALNVVAPNFFDLTEDGLLKITDKLNTDFIAEMRRKNIKVIPFLSNHWNREIGIRALERRDTLAKQIADAVERYGLDGVNVDIENVTERERDAYVQFIRAIRAALPKDKEVSVAVSAVPDGTPTGWQRSYDYKALAEHSDYLVVMAYDETSEGDPVPGPVASIGFVEQSIRYAINQTPPDKIVLGVPFYGRYWKSDGTAKGKGIPNKTVNMLIDTYGGDVRFDEKTKSPYAVITVPPNGAPPFDSTLTPGTYTIWFENDQSLKQKLNLVETYGLRGASAWSLGQEDARTWNYFALWLNGAAFPDAEGHWAQNDIAAMADRKWMNGVADNRFAPDEPLTRSQAAVILARALTRGDVPSASGAPFDDVPAGHWAYAEIGFAKRRGIVEGVGERAFAPDRTITREQMAAMLARALRLAPSATALTDGRFRDVGPDDWAFPFIVALAERGIALGYDAGLFRPKRPVSRAEMAALMNRAGRVIDSLPPSPFEND